jgi:TonB-linked SusC/RagA family outer membrane protein
VVKGTTIGSISDVNGNFRIEVPVDAEVIVCTYVGMKTQEINIVGLRNFDIVMEQEAIGIEEVVAIGYGTQKRINLTGAVSTVSSEELADRPVASVAEALQGVVPNLNISTTDGGRPGSDLEWNIRGIGTIGGGQASPLILIDGVPGNVNNLNPADIENISVLKDAAASAIYGSRAPYGVVIITTKKGKTNQMKVTFNSNLAGRIPTQMIKPMGSLDLIKYYNESSANIGAAPFFPQAHIDALMYAIENPGSPNKTINPTDPSRYQYNVAVDEDWWGATYKNLALAQNYNINVSGGSENVTYYASFGTFDQDGLYKIGDDNFKRYTGLLNLNAEVTKWLEFGYRINASRRNFNRPVSHSEMQYAAFREWPINPVKEPTGYYSANARGLNIAEDGGRKSDITDAFDNTLSFIFKPVGNFNIKGDLTLNTYNQRYDQNDKIVNRYDALGNIFGAQSGATTTGIRKERSVNKFYSANIYADYTKQVADHNFYVLAGYQQEYNNWERLTGSRNDLLAQDLPSLRTATGSNIILLDDENEWATQGYFGRFTYNYREKYLFEVNGRYDGSSRFPKDLRWGFFPSGSVGYIISRESFFNPLNDIIS